MSTYKEFSINNKAVEKAYISRIRGLEAKQQYKALCQLETQTGMEISDLRDILVEAIVDGDEAIDFSPVFSEMASRLAQSEMSKDDAEMFTAKLLQLLESKDAETATNQMQESIEEVEGEEVGGLGRAFLDTISEMIDNLRRSMPSLNESSRRSVRSKIELLLKVEEDALTRCLGKDV